MRKGPVSRRCAPHAPRLARGRVPRSRVDGSSVPSRNPLLGVSPASRLGDKVDTAPPNLVVEVAGVTPPLRGGDSINQASEPRCRVQGWPERLGA